MCNFKGNTTCPESGEKMDRLLRLYPKVDEAETPLPRAWSAKDKYTYIGLSQSNLKVHYKGSGKNHKDAASVRTGHPIPAAAGVYYFEIKVISKGRDGYMGIGLSSNGVNLNRLPGWEKNSYGYHADDGCVFSCSGTGQQYGPTFTTGDVVGCGFNLVDRTIFFTKNGISLGTAVSDVPSSQVLYPTVGLQTPGEVVEANFGETPFVFDFEGMLADMQQQIRHSIETFSVSDGQGAWQTNLHKLVLSYLVHHGYSQSAQVFSSSTGQHLDEDVLSIRSRQKIQLLVLAGRISEAMRLVESSYPGLLASNPELLFKLKCRQFVEMIGGYDRGEAVISLEPRLSCHSELSSSNPASPNPIQPTNESTATTTAVTSSMAMEEEGASGSSTNRGAAGGFDHCGMNGVPVRERVESDIDEAMVMEVDSPLLLPGEEDQQGRGGGASVDLENPVDIEKVLSFGRDLQALFNQVMASKPNDKLKTMLQDSFSLLAYTDPRSSPVGYLLDPLQREPVCSALNSAILESKKLQGQPPLEFALGQAAQCLKHMSRNGLGSAAFTGVQDIVNS